MFKQFSQLMLSLLFWSVTSSDNLFSPCLNPTSSGIEQHNGNVPFTPSKICSGQIIQYGTRFEGYDSVRNQVDTDPHQYMCAHLSKTTSVKSFFIIGRQSFYDVWTTFPSGLKISVSVWDHQTGNKVGDCISTLDGGGWYICDQIHIGNQVCMEQTRHGNLLAVGLLVFDKYPIQLGAYSVSANPTYPTLNNIISKEIYLNVYSDQVISSYFKRARNNPQITIEFNAQMEFSSISLFPRFKSALNSDYKMPNRDQDCRAFRNNYLISITDVDEKTYPCTSLTKQLRYYIESKCNGIEAYKVNVAIDQDDDDQVYSGAYCAVNYQLFALQSINVLADCDCDKTSLVNRKMPQAPNLTPNIVKDLTIFIGGDRYEILFPLGYDTVSWNCGTLDGNSTCGSDTGIYAKFEDGLTGMDLQLSSRFITWDNGKVILEPTQENQIGYHSIKVTLLLRDYPNAEGRSYFVNVTVLATLTNQTEIETLKQTAVCFIEDVTEVPLRSLINPQEGESIVLEMTQEQPDHNLIITIDQLSVYVESSSASDLGTHLVNLLAIFINEPNRLPQPIEVSLLLKEKFQMPTVEIQNPIEALPERNSTNPSDETNSTNSTNSTDSTSQETIISDIEEDIEEEIDEVESSLDSWFGFQKTKKKPRQVDKLIVGKISFDGHIQLVLSQPVQLIEQTASQLEKNDYYSQLLELTYIPVNEESKDNFIGWNATQETPLFLNLALSFKNPSLVQKDDFFSLKVNRVNQARILQTLTDNQAIFIENQNVDQRMLQQQIQPIKSGTKVQWNMVPQISAETQVLIDKASENVNTAMTASMVSAMVIQLAVGTSLKKIWSLLFCLQLHLFIVLKFTQPLYSAFQLACFQQLDDMIKLKFIPKEYIIREYIAPQIDQQQLKEAFWIVIPILLVLTLVLISLLVYLVRKQEKLRSKLAEIKKKFMWNSIIQSLMIGYLGYATTFVIGTQKMLYPLVLGDYEIEQKIKIETGAIVFGVISIGFAIFIPLKIQANQDQLESVAWQDKFGRLTKEIEIDYPHTRYFLAWLISRRLALALLLFLSFGQAQLSVSLSLTLIYLLLKRQPYDNIKQNDFELFNEMTVLIASLQSLACSPYTETLSQSEAMATRYAIGINQITVIAMLILINYASIMILTINKASQVVKNKIQKRKQEKIKKQPEPKQQPTKRPTIKTESSSSQESERSINDITKKSNAKVKLDLIPEQEEVESDSCYLESYQDSSSRQNSDEYNGKLLEVQTKQKRNNTKIPAESKTTKKQSNGFKTQPNPCNYQYSPKSNPNSEFSELPIEQQSERILEEIKLPSQPKKIPQKFDLSNVSDHKNLKQAFARNNQDLTFEEYLEKHYSKQLKNLKQSQKIALIHGEHSFVALKAKQEEKRVEKERREMHEQANKKQGKLRFDVFDAFKKDDESEEDDGDLYFKMKQNKPI